MLVLTNLRIVGHHLAVLTNQLLLFFVTNNNNENVKIYIDFTFIFKNKKVTK
jgi:hypothetical protein